MGHKGRYPSPASVASRVGEGTRTEIEPEG